MKLAPRDKKLDLEPNAAFSIARTERDLQRLLSTKDVDAGLLDAKSSAATLKKKKRINIPITDVTIDEDYEKLTYTQYSLPKTYVQYSRRIGDDSDITLDYNLDTADREWLSSHTVISVDKECKRFFSDAAFEEIINILERHTGGSKEAVPQLHAHQLISEKFQWSPTMCSKVVPDIYAYWLNKRDALKKPLCRRYWPQTPAADKNPHLTFRPRGHEKYRLRKQHRKNDLDAFRKMQQLRREFSKALDLVYLLVERDSLAEAEAEVDKEIFEQTVWDLSYSRPAGIGITVKGKAANIAKRRQPHQKHFTHCLKHEKLLVETEVAPAAIALDDPVWNQSGAHRKGVAPAGLTSGGSHAAQAQKAALQEAEARKASRRVSQMSGSQIQSGTSRSVRRGPSAIDVAPDDAVAAPVHTGLVPSHAQAVEISALQSMHAALPGPATACRPAWPHFLDPAALRDEGSWNAPTTLSSYLDELQGETLKTVDDEETFCEFDIQDIERPWGHRGSFSSGGGSTGGGMLGKYRIGPSAAEKRAVELDASLTSAYDAGSVEISPEFPKSSVEETVAALESHAELLEAKFNARLTYRCRGRVGRGGRLVIDRIPVLFRDDLLIRRKSRHVDTDSSSFSEFQAAYEEARANAAVGTEASRRQRHLFGENAHTNTHRGVSTSSVSFLQAPGLLLPVEPAAAAPAKTPTTGTSIASSSGASITLLTAAPSQPKLLKETYIVPPSTPLERPIVAPGLLARQSEILACSDSEDESVGVDIDCSTSARNKFQIML